MKKIIMFLILLSVMLVTASNVSAADNSTDDVVSVDECKFDLDIANSDEELLSSMDNSDNQMIDESILKVSNEENVISDIERIDDGYDYHKLEMSPLIAKYGESITYTVKTPVVYNGPGIRNVQLFDNSRSLIGSVLPVNGVATFDLGKLNVGIHKIYAVYNVGNDFPEEWSQSAYIQVINSPIETSVSSSNIVTSYNSGKSLIIILKDKRTYLNNVDEITFNVLTNSYKDTLSNMKVSVNIGGSVKNLKTDKNGQIKLSLNGIKAGRYVAKITFAGDKYYAKSTTLVNVVIHKVSSYIYAKSQSFKVKVKSKNVKITLRDNNDKIIKNAKITLKINGKKYTAKTSKKGVATFKVNNLNKKGSYKGTVNFAGNSCYKATNEKIKITVKK